MYLEGLANIVKVGSILSYCWMTIEKLQNLGKGKDENWKSFKHQGFQFLITYMNSPGPVLNQHLVIFLYRYVQGYFVFKQASFQFVKMQVTY